MYAAVPATGCATSITSRPASGEARDTMPKSMSTGDPSRRTNTLAGLRSRCTIPCACTKPSGSQSARRSVRASRSRPLPASRTTSAGSDGSAAS
ncbi:MAG: hypothetical protein R3A52_11305 [Polyangiales bacterium]